HYLPVFARLGAYDKGVLDRLLFERHADYIEYWAHQASVIPIADWPLFGWRRRFYREVKPDHVEWSREHAPMLEFLKRELAEKGPLSAGQVEHERNERRGPWWGWSDVKTGLEILFDRGEVVASHRRNFERHYDLPERRIPEALLHREVPERDAVRELVRTSARALGIGTVRDIADYYRILQTPAKAAILELVDAGELLPVTVPGWGRPAYLHRDARIPRRIEAVALLSPFDPIVWERERTLRMFGFHYRIEIYTPAPKRVFGYYTLPLLIDEALAGRIDLKSDRRAGVLLVQSAWREGDAAVDLDRVVALLRATASWQGLERVEVADRGDLAGELRAAVG
ncbi:MAG: crosslink repair DNA glycosylase YcaQ family protein, partial [Rhodoglobus sp.]